MFHVAAFVLLLQAAGAESGAADRVHTLLGSRCIAEPGSSRLAVYFDATPSFHEAEHGALILEQTRIRPLIPTAIARCGPFAGGTFQAVGKDVLLRLDVPPNVRIAPTRTGTSLLLSPDAGSGSAGSVPASAPSAGPVGEIDDDVVERYDVRFGEAAELANLLVAPQPGLASFDPTGGAQLSSFNGNSYAGGYGGIPQSSAVTTPAAAGGDQARPLSQKLTENVSIDRRLNAIFLSGTRRQVARLRKILELGDVPGDAVQLEVRVFEVTSDDAKDIGLDFGVNGLAQASYDFRTLSTAQGIVSAQATLFDLVRRGKGRIVATPSVTALNGTTASILTGDALPILTSFTIAGSATVVQQQVQYVNVGVTLTIQPRITREALVFSRISAEVSSVSGYTGGFPRISQRVASASTTVADGQAFIIGGLVREEEIDSMSKIPGVGDLPIIGGLFRVRHTSRQSRTLYLTVTPHIVRLHGNAPPAPTPAPAIVPK